MKKLKSLSTIVLVALLGSVSAHSQQAVELPYPVQIQPTAQEAAMAPLLDLYNGGQAVGAAQGKPATDVKPATTGSLVNGAQMPKKGVGFENVATPVDDWGTGLMISFLMNAAPLMAQQYPGNVLYIGAIAQQNGGPYAPHSSHQNGLDADILFVGTNSYNSVLDKDGTVTSRFDILKNWSLWRLAVQQQVVQNGKPISAVSMILIDPRLKTYACAWAKSRESTLDALDREILGRLRPTEGHDNHFHLRFRCSPHYASCINGGEANARLTGCPELDPPHAAERPDPAMAFD